MRIDMKTPHEGLKVIKVEEGSNVTLPCYLWPKKDLRLTQFVWEKTYGNQEVFPYDKGDLYSDERPGPKVITVEEGSDVTLPCSLRTKEDIWSTWFIWKKTDDGQKVFLYCYGDLYSDQRPGQSEQFKGRVSHFPDELKQGNASIIIRNTRRADSGIYRCYFPYIHTPQEFYIKLVVGAADEPFVATLEQTEDWSLLQCKVHGNPEPEVEWQDSAGNKLPAEKPQVEKIKDHFYITINTTVTKSDRYRCVATQEAFNHTISAVTFVPFIGV
ncbi:butyrophilin-like protein 1 [Sander vitreus]